ncbi:MAG: SurA N-terminal domain-containing protein [Dissulfurispiraceae bacterium]
MKKTYRVALTLTLTLAVCLSVYSCKRQSDHTRETQKEVSADQERKMEEIRTGVEQSKKVIVAKVNGEGITQYALMREMNEIASLYVRDKKEMTPEITEMIRKEALNRAIFRALAVQEARRQGMTVLPQAVDDAIKKIRESMGSPEAYSKYLEHLSMTEDQLRKEIEEGQLLQRILAKEVYDKITVDEKTLKRSYETEKSKFLTRDNPPRQMTYQEARPSIEAYIKTQRGRELREQWEKSLRREAKVEIMPMDGETKLK